MPKKKVEVQVIPYGTGKPGKAQVVKREKGTTKPMYVTNKELLEEFRLCKSSGVLSNKMAGYLVQVATKFSYHHWFRGYSFRDDLVQEAVLQLCTVWDRFDEEKSQNYFSWATQVAYRTFQYFLFKEKQQREIRDQLLIDQGVQASWNASNGKSSDELMLAVEANSYAQADSSKNSDETAFTTVKTE